jgi:hypothetical protein
LLGGKSRINRLFRSQKDKEEIAEIRELIAADIHEFTVCNHNSFVGDISILIHSVLWEHFY